MRSGPAILDEVKNRIPAKRLGEADEVADAVLYLASDSAAYITGRSHHDRRRIDAVETENLGVGEADESIENSEFRRRPMHVSGLLPFNPPWTARPVNWYILTCLTESLYLGWFTGRRPTQPQGVASLAASPGVGTILAGISRLLHDTYYSEHTVCK